MDQIKEIEYEMLKRVNEVRREMRDILVAWGKSKEPAWVYQEDVENMKRLTAEFEDRFERYEEVKKARIISEKVKSYKIDIESAKLLNKIYNELNKVSGGLDEYYDYEEDPYNSIETMNHTFEIPKLVRNMKEFIKLTEQ